MQKMIKEPKDLGIKILPKEEAAWTRIKEGVEKELGQGKRELIINMEILKLAERKIEEEKGK